MPSRLSPVSILAAALLVATGCGDAHESSLSGAADHPARVPLGHDLTARFAMDGARLGTGLRVQVAAFGRQGAPSVVAAAAPLPARCAGTRRCPTGTAWAHGGGLVSWWLARGDGRLEQGFDVARPPAGTGALVVDVALDGAAGLRAHGDLATFTDATDRRWRMTGLHAVDALRRPLPARFVVTGERLRIEVDDAGATYPVSIDPFLETPLATLTGSAEDAFGTSVSGAGDVNGDGFDDVAVGAPGDSPGGLSLAGSVRVYHGAAGAISGSPDIELNGSQVLGYFGTTVLLKCDFDQDGYDDLAVGAPYEDEGSEEDGGGVHVFWGSATGLDASEVWTERLSDGDSGLGLRLDCGDLTGDGFPDLVVSAPWFDDGEDGEGGTDGATYDEGRAWIHLGGADRFDDGAHQTLQYDPQSYNDPGWHGMGVAVLGDTDGDGLADLGIGQPGRRIGGWTMHGGKIYVHGGAAGGVDESWMYSNTGRGNNERLGWSMAGGDLDGDGYGDFVWGTPRHHDPDRGAFWFRPGGPDGLDGDQDTTQISGENDGDDFAEQMASAGDVDGDGYDDLLVAAPGYDDDRGKVYLYGGSSVGPTTVIFSDVGDDPSDELSLGMAGAGDVDGFYAREVLVGAPGDDSAGTNAGKVWIWRAYDDGDDADGDGVSSSLDCDDDDPLVGGWSWWWPDEDHDGYGTDEAGYATLSCGDAWDTSPNADDCDDADASISPGAAEVCDPGDVDEDCDGQSDDEDDDVTGRSTWYYDYDGNSYGTSALITLACSRPDGYGTTDGFTADSGDCDDLNDGASPGLTEVCDGADVDEDCDGLADNEDASATRTHLWGYDGDGDGYGDPATATSACDAPGEDWVRDYTDCDDTDPTGATAETWYFDYDRDGWGSTSIIKYACGQPDDFIGGTWVLNAWDCDDMLSYIHTPYWYYLDEDGDGWGVTEGRISSCDFSMEGYAQNQGGDCDDADGAVHPSATEVCDAADVDEDCDGLSDEADDSLSGASAWFLDGDDDGYGTFTGFVLACEQPAGRVDNALDCDDAHASAHPGATEVCDAEDVDEDCDGLADNDDGDEGADPASFVTLYADEDHDGYGTPADTIAYCDPIAGWAASSGDCDDTRADIRPGATEVCDAGDVDEDCDGLADDADGSVAAAAWYADGDGDGWGSSADALVACDLPAGRVDVGGDCDDAQPLANPGATEICDAGDLDEDCDGQADDADPEGPATSSLAVLYQDGDLDGYGTTAAAILGCDPVEGWAVASGDCDDADSELSPGISERCDPGDVDEDCDGLADEADGSLSDASAWYLDADGDGFGAAAGFVLACEAPAGRVGDGTDCDDGHAAAHPGGTEVCDADDLDEDCDGLADDDDGDEGADPSTFLTWYVDGDGDGHGSATDTILACDAITGWAGSADDCDDSAADVYPDATETCDDRDEDCDGLADDGLPDADADLVCDEVDPCPDDAPDDADGDGVCDSEDFRLEASIIAGTAWIRALDADPGAAVYFLGSPRQGTGPTCAPGGAVCVDLTQAVLLGRVVANGQGTAVLSLAVPATVPSGTTLRVQAATQVGAVWDTTNRAWMTVP